MTKNFVAYRLVIDYSLIIGNNQWLINWLPIDYLLITHWFHWCHWCHRLVMPGITYASVLYFPRLFFFRARDAGVSCATLLSLPPPQAFPRPSKRGFWRERRDHVRARSASGGTGSERGARAVGDGKGKTKISPRWAIASDWGRGRFVPVSLVKPGRLNPWLHTH